MSKFWGFLKFLVVQTSTSPISQNDIKTCACAIKFSRLWYPRAKIKVHLFITFFVYPRCRPLLEPTRQTTSFRSSIKSLHDLGIFIRMHKDQEQMRSSIFCVLLNRHRHRVLREYLTYKKNRTVLRFSFPPMEYGWTKNMRNLRATSFASLISFTGQSIGHTVSGRTFFEIPSLPDTTTYASAASRNPIPLNLSRPTETLHPSPPIVKQRSKIAWVNVECLNAFCCLLFTYFRAANYAATYAARHQLTSRSQTSIAINIPTITPSHNHEALSISTPHPHNQKQLLSMGQQSA